MIFFAFFLSHSHVLGVKSSNFAAKIKNYMLMLVYKLLKIAPDGDEFANTTLGLLFGLMEAGLALWFLIEMLSNR